MAQMTPFELFGLKPAFKVDLEALHAAHERAILQVHPDRFADRPAAERRVAEQWLRASMRPMRCLKTR